MKRPRPSASLILARKWITLLRENVPTSYGVRFDNRWAGIQFRYSWEIVLSKN
jgi:hypothetical protein